MPIRRPHNTHSDVSPSSPPSPSSPSHPSSSSSHSTFAQATPPSAFLPSHLAMFDPFSNASPPRRKPYSPFSAFESRPPQSGQKQADAERPTSVASAYSYEAEPVEPAVPAAHAQAHASGQGGNRRRSTLSFEIGGEGNDSDTDREREVSVPQPAPEPAPAPVQPPAERQPQPAQDYSAEDSSREEDSAETCEGKREESVLIPPRPRFLTDASRASWSSQDSSLYPSSVLNSDTELAAGTASDSDRERERANENMRYTPPASHQHAYKHRSNNGDNIPGGGGAAAAGRRGLPPGAAPPIYAQAQGQTHTRAAPYPTARRYSGGAHRRSSSGATAQQAAAGVAGAEVLGEEIERAESPSALGAATSRPRGVAPPSAFRGSRTSASFPSPVPAAGANVPEDAHPLSSNVQSEDTSSGSGNGEGRDAPSSVGHASSVSASSGGGGAAAAATAAYAHQYPHNPSGYQYPPSPVPSPASPLISGMGGPVYPGGAAYHGGAGYPAPMPGAGYAPGGQPMYANYANVAPGPGPNGQQMSMNGGSAYAAPIPRGPPPPLPHNAFMANSAIARNSMSGSAVDLVPYAARFNGGMGGYPGYAGYGSHSRRNSVDVGGVGQFAPPQPPFAQSGGAGYLPPSPGTPGTPELRHAGSLPRLREPFLSPTSRRSSSVWAPPTPAVYTAGNVGYEGDGRAGSGFFGGYAYNGVGTGSSTVLALPGKKEPLPSSALQRKISVSEKPWIKQREKGERASWWLTFCIMWVGIAVGGLVCFLGYTSVQKIKSPLCSVLDDDFSSFNTDTWSKNVSLGGFGNGEFQMTTDSSDNLYIKNGQLYIMPTLTSDEIGSSSVFDGYTYNLTGCTESWNASDCSVRSDQSTNTVVNPVKSARISTKDSVSIAYGKVEVVAKMPRGDWLWPAIWMLPTDEKYGPWPMSGEIDIVEARGNSPSYPSQGDNFVRSSLNWGPLPNVIATAFGWQTEKRSTFAADFHTYTLEWTPSFMRMSVDSKLHAMLDLNLAAQSFWARGGFPATAQNGSTEAVVGDIWEGQPNAAPFDQQFYLIVDLAVGGTSGWFPDNDGGKMWFDGSATAMTDFAKAQDTWSATWPSSDDDRALRIDSVKMWKLC